ncbi:TetR/AcrR family transcriptional regulator [Companilactobacillus keshanensis]|uniref:TetR/AcrR family transcriptional regulator n=1 Tax=Companilactobacillus keshanensis TaxID=2486003 RepID=A0ABW4BWY7_9LACO|nr:TetR/AcrR family transcriptional regulator [Companilactobacillus keshanensis]
MDRDKTVQNVTRMQIQTKIWIKDALLELLKTYNFNEITIKQIVLTAGISRPTFYRLYKSKNETLKETINDIWYKYSQSVHNLDPKSYKQLLLYAFEYFGKNHDDLKILIDSDLSSYLSKSATSIFIKEISDNPAIWREWQSPLEKTIGVQLGFGGMINVLFNWISTDCRTPEDKMVSEIMKVLQSLAKEN